MGHSVLFAKVTLKLLITFFLIALPFAKNFEMIWSSLNHKIKNCNLVDADNIIQFILNLDKPVTARVSPPPFRFFDRVCDNSLH